MNKGRENLDGLLRERKENKGFELPEIGKFNDHTSGWKTTQVEYAVVLLVYIWLIVLVEKTEDR